MLVMRAGLMAGAAGISVCLCASAMAQTTPAVSGDQMGIAETPVTASAEDAAAAQGGLGDIVVTGRKRVRGEALQNTPLAITALGPAQLQSQSVEDLVDVGRLVPNASLQSSSQRGLQNFSIRGMGITASTASDEPAVGMIQDGVYWGSNYGAVGQLLDLEGVEIMRGPQGTLFGRNVTGGAAVIRTARPTNDYYAKLSVGVGNLGAVEGSAVGNLPLVDQTLAARIAVMGDCQDFRVRAGG